MTCTIEGCDQPYEARGWCAMHYRRWQRNGDPLVMGLERRSAPPRPKPQCLADGCPLKAHNRGRCRRHYEELRNSPEGLPQPPSTEERFWSKVDRRQPDECWPWAAGIGRDGYGRFSVNRHARFAHRFAYELLVEPIPEGLVLDHRCHTFSTCGLGEQCPHRRCVNPAHLDLVTAEENTRRAQFSYRLAGSHVA